MCHIEMPKGLPFSVDTWSSSSMRKRHHFLTHAHKDHSQGISSYSSYPIYATPLTKTLTLHYYPQLSDSLFVDIQVGQSIVVDDPFGAFTVTAFDANHCPGAVMFLFEGPFGNILHTGDSRLTPECLQNLPEKYLGKKDREPKVRLDYVFLDCTFGRFSRKMPSKHSAIQQVGNQEAVDIVMRSCLAEKKLESRGETDKLKHDEIGCCVSMSPSPKLRRITLVKKKRKPGQSPVYRRTVDAEDDRCKDNEIESSPLKARRVSLIDQTKIKSPSLDLENCIPKKRKTCGGLMAACKEIANLAVSRGSFDDITVMIIDLNRYQS